MGTRFFSRTLHYFLICFIILVCICLNTVSFFLSSPVVHLKSDSTDFLSFSGAKKRNVIFLIYDAFRIDFAADVVDGNEQHINRMTSISKLLEDEPMHARLFNFKADLPTFTSQRIVSIASGGLPRFFEVASTFNPEPRQEDSLLQQFQSNGFSVFQTGDEVWNLLYKNDIDEAHPFPSLDALDLHTVDNGILSLMPEELKSIRSYEGKENRVRIFHFLGVDHAGHVAGIAHQAMYDKLDQYDKILSNLIQHLKENEPDTILLLFGDHGMTDGGNHGGLSFSETDAALFAYSPSVKFHASSSFSPKTLLPPEEESIFTHKWTNLKNSPRTVRQVDFAPTIAALTKIPIPFSSVGRLVPDLLPVDVELADARKELLYSQINDEMLRGRRVHLDLMVTNLEQVARYYSSHPQCDGFDNLDTCLGKDIQFKQNLMVIRNNFLKLLDAEEMILTQQIEVNSIKKLDAELIQPLLENIHALISSAAMNASKNWLTFDILTIVIATCALGCIFIALFVQLIIGADYPILPFHAVKALKLKQELYVSTPRISASQNPSPTAYHVQESFSISSSTSSFPINSFCFDHSPLNIESRVITEAVHNYRITARHDAEKSCIIIPDVSSQFLIRVLFFAFGSIIVFLTSYFVLDIRFTLSSALGVLLLSGCYSWSLCKEMLMSVHQTQLDQNKLFDSHKNHVVNFSLTHLSTFISSLFNLVVRSISYHPWSIFFTVLASVPSFLAAISLAMTKNETILLPPLSALVLLLAASVQAVFKAYRSSFLLLASSACTCLGCMVSLAEPWHEWKNFTMPLVAFNSPLLASVVICMITICSIGYIWTAHHQLKILWQLYFSFTLLISTFGAMWHILGWRSYLCPTYMEGDDVSSTASLFCRASHSFINNEDHIGGAIAIVGSFIFGCGVLILLLFRGIISSFFRRSEVLANDDDNVWFSHFWIFRPSYIYSPISGSWTRSNVMARALVIAVILSSQLLIGVSVLFLGVGEKQILPFIMLLLSWSFFLLSSYFAFIERQENIEKNCSKNTRIGSMRPEDMCSSEDEEELFNRTTNTVGTQSEVDRVSPDNNASSILPLPSLPLLDLARNEWRDNKRPFNGLSSAAYSSLLVMLAESTFHLMSHRKSLETLPLSAGFVLDGKYHAILSPLIASVRLLIPYWLIGIWMCMIALWDSKREVYIWRGLIRFAPAFQKSLLQSIVGVFLNVVLVTIISWIALVFLREDLHVWMLFAPHWLMHSIILAVTMFSVIGSACLVVAASGLGETKIRTVNRPKND